MYEGLLNDLERVERQRDEAWSALGRLHRIILGLFVEYASAGQVPSPPPPRYVFPRSDASGTWYACADGYYCDVDTTNKAEACARALVNCVQGRHYAQVLRERDEAWGELAEMGVRRG